MSGPIINCGCPYDDRLRQGHRDRCPTLKALTWPDGTPKVAPVQGFTPGIPWSLHLEAYDAYAKRWSSQTALIDLDRRGCRGGFGTKELDGFVPGWRERVSEISALRAKVADAREALTKAAEAFRMYEQSHQEKADEAALGLSHGEYLTRVAKAERNRVLAEMCESASSEIGGDHG